MATNFEFYKKRLKENFKGAYNGTCMVEAIEGAIGVDIHEKCQGITCAECVLHAIEWLLAEHIEQPKLTKRERAFCEALQTGWIARDENGKIHWYETEPHNDEEEWLCDGHQFINFTQLRLFAFIEWGDEKPWAVEDLLKLEVEE